MYAVIKTSGRQYRVSPGDSFSVEKLDGAPGSAYTLSEVLMIGGDKTLLGAPHVDGATVTLIIEKQFRGTKVFVFKKKRRHKYRNRRGHRSELTQVFVSEIASPAGTVKAETKPHVFDAARAERAAEHKQKHSAAPVVAAADGEEGAKAPKKASASGAKKKSAAKGTKKTAAKKTSTKKPAAKKAKR